MRNLADIEFDHDRLGDVVKHRKMGAGVTYEQDGVLFSSGFVALKILRETPKRDAFDDMTPDELRAELRNNNIKPPKKAGKKATTRKPQSTRERADDKLAGFKTDEQPDYIQQALSENHAAVMAEESAQ